MVYSSWAASKQSTVASVFLSYLLNFTLQWLARETKEQKISYRIRNIHFKVFLFGLSSLFAANLLQGGVFQALMCWGMFLCILLLHYLNFKDTDAKKRAMADILYYILLITWYVGIIAHYGAQIQKK